MASIFIRQNLFNLLMTSLLYVYLLPQRCIWLTDLLKNQQDCNTLMNRKAYCQYQLFCLYIDTINAMSDQGILSFFLQTIKWKRSTEDTFIKRLFVKLTKIIQQLHKITKLVNSYQLVYVLVVTNIMSDKCYLVFTLCYASLGS